MSDFRIIGNANPEIGKEIIYTVNNLNNTLFPTQPTENPFHEEIHWSIYIMQYGKWHKKEKNNKTGSKVTYTFSEVSLKREGIKIVAQMGEYKATLDIKPQKIIDRKIIGVELCDALGKKQTKPFSYGQTVIARVHATNLDNCTVHLTLWEDDAPGARHNEINKNNKAITKSELIANGIADLKFTLDSNFSQIANAQLANGDKDEGKNHEYYVTAEIFRQKKVSSNNINVINPDYKTNKEPKSIAPADSKEKSKKETKGINKSENKLHDYYETKVSVKPTFGFDPVEKINSLMTVNIDSNWWEKKEEKKPNTCECEARIRAFMRMIRVGEATGELIKSYDKIQKKIVYITHDFQKGYTTAFGGNLITDLSTHPQKNYGGSTAAGAYQVMRYTWWWLNGEELDDNNLKIGTYKAAHDYIKKYNITDYSEESQDKICIALMKSQRPNLIERITKNEIENAIRKDACFIWASLPEIKDESHYFYKGIRQQATSMEKCIEHYEKFLKEELRGISNLHLKKGFLKDFNLTCNCGLENVNSQSTGCGR